MYKTYPDSHCAPVSLSVSSMTPSVFQAMRTPQRSSTGLALLFEYYNQLYYIERRLFPPDRHLGVYFEWCVFTESSGAMHGWLWLMSIGDFDAWTVCMRDIYLLLLSVFGSLRLL